MFMGQPDGAGSLPLCCAVIVHRVHGEDRNHRIMGVSESELALCNGGVVRDWNVGEQQGRGAPVRAVSLLQDMRRLELWMWSELRVLVQEGPVRMGH